MTTLSNPILWSDGYKYSHWLQNPEGTEEIYSYWMSRGGKFPEVAQVGMQYLNKEYLQTPITKEHIEEASEIIHPYFNDEHMFNRAGFERIVNKYGGFWPVEIKTAPEGLYLPTGNILLSTRSTDSQLPWTGQFLETILSLLWYPSTIATLSREIKKVLLASLEKTGTPELIGYKLHDFGMRGAASIEAGAIGGFAHLTNFFGTDTTTALQIARKIYGTENAGSTLPASEHANTTIFGMQHEYEAYKSKIQQFGKCGSGLYAMVIDSYNDKHAVDEIIGKQLKKLILEQPNLLVVRPDSGIPWVIVPEILQLLEANFGATLNNKGYKVLNHVRVIQGDGVNMDSIKQILTATESLGYSTDNLAFGMGGALLSGSTRDTQKFAIKASSAIINGRVVDFRKEPVGDKGKWSRDGRLKLIRDEVTGAYRTVRESELGDDILQLVYRNGETFNETTLTEIRQRAAL